MNNAPIFDESLLGKKTSKLNSALWPKVVEKYEQKQYKECLLELFNYVNNEIVKDCANADLTEFVIPHGSMKIFVNIKDGLVKLTAPFLKIPAQTALPLMRQVCEINFATLTSSQIVLNNDQLCFEFSCPLELCEPWKMYGILNEVCANSDYYDDYFIQKYGATRLSEMAVEQFSVAEQELAWNKFQQYLQEGSDYIKYFEEKRIYGFAWDSIILTFMKIDYFMSPQGYLKIEMEKAILAMYGESPLNERISKGKEAIEKLKNYDRSKLNASLYKVKSFISEKRSLDLGGFQNELKSRFEDIKKEIASTDYQGASLSLIFFIFRLFYYNKFSLSLEQTLTDGLKESSGKTWKEASLSLFTVMENLFLKKIEQENIALN